MKSKLVSLLILVLLLAASGTWTHAQQPGFTETFDNPALSGWELSSNASLVDGQLIIDGNGYALRGGSWTDPVIIVEFRKEGSGGLAFHYQVSNSGNYIVRLSEDGLQLMFDHQGEVTELASDLTILPLTEWNQLTIKKSGEVHSIFLNDQLVLEKNVPNSLPEGGLLFSTEPEVTAFIDAVVVQVGEVQSPGEDTAAEESLEADDSTYVDGDPAYKAPLWVSLGGPPGGLGYDIRMRPDNPDEMYVTDAFAGIFKSVDGGQTWFATNGNLLFGADQVSPIFCATIDPHDYDVVWIGTQITGHLYRSEDAGQSWEVRDNGITHDGRSLRGITIDPNNADIVFVGLEVEAGQWQREHPEATADMAGGEVYKSTNSGLTWTRIWQGPNVARYVWIDPRNSNRVYVSTGIFDRIPANSNHAANDPGGVGILRSDDGGQTWMVLDEKNGLGGRIIPSLFMHPTNPDMLIAAVYGSNIKNGVFVTRDGGDSWEQSLDYPTGMHNVEIATSNPDIWYAATEGPVFRSDDAGKNWQNYRLATQDRDAGMPIDLQVDPRDPYRVFVNNYGGSNFVSTDGGVTWVDASKGYTGAWVTLFMLPNDKLVAGAQTGMFNGNDGGLTWVGLNIVEDGAVATDPLSHVLLPYGDSVLHSTDGGASWSKVKFIDLYAEQQAGRIRVDLLASRLAVAPSDRQTVYLSFLDAVCGSGIKYCFDPMPGFFRSHDGGYTWEEVTGGPFKDAETFRIAVHPQDSQKLFAATSRGLYMSSDGGDAWQHVSALNEEAAQVEVWDPSSELSQSNAVIITEVVFDPFNANTLYAAALQKGVFRSDDGGATWQTVSYGMDPNEPVLAIIADANRPGLLYASSLWSGVFVSVDGAQTWRLINNGLMKLDVVSLALSADGSILYAGTMTGGAWRLGGGELGLMESSETQPEIPPSEPETQNESVPTNWGLVVGAAILILLIGIILGVSLNRMRK